MKLRTLLCLVMIALGLTGAARADDEVRFTKTLSAAEVTQLGLNRLSSDQLGSLDALVRRDIATAEVTDPAKHPRPARFSDRLRADERVTAGLNLLDASELTQLDAAVQKLVPPPRGAWLATAQATESTPIYSEPIHRGPEVHGEVSLMVAAGSHGYSAYGGGIAVTVDDPQHHLALTVAYSEIHEKGGYLRRDCRDGYLPFNTFGMGLTGLP